MGKVKTKLSALDTSQIHYVKVPENHIVVDFDIPDETGNKSSKRIWKPPVSCHRLMQS